MSLGVTLTDEDLQAVAKLYHLRWTATIKNWKERYTDYCLWIVDCPNKDNVIFTESGTSLSEVIDKLLSKALEYSYGFPIHGYRGIGGVEMTNDDLDLCHGHQDADLSYHYHATLEYPYTIGCYKGAPISIDNKLNRPAHP